LLENSGDFRIYETGIYRNITGIYASGDIFRISVESGIVKYYRNGALLYTSLLPPTLPLLVDVSINEVGGTVTNATITNYHTGTFTATATNAGTAPNYRWLVNGIQVQNGISATYTNVSLAQNDVVTCELTPNLAGCSNLTPLPSNTITHTAIPPALSDYYLKGVPVSTSCTMLQEEVKWKNADLLNVNATLNDIVKFQSDGVYDGGAASWNTVSLNGYLQFTTAENNLAKAAGLSPTNTNANNLSIAYAFSLFATGELRIMESGVDRGITASYAAGDLFRMSVENVAGVNRVRYYKNNILLYTSTLTASVLPMLVDASIYNVGGTLNDVIVSNPNNGSFTAGTVNAGTPNYNWKVNGISVQNGASSTYTNGSLAHNAVITCEITPGLTGCNTVAVVSNITTFKGTVVSITTPPAVCSPLTIDLTDPSITAGTSPDIVLTYWTNPAATLPLVTPTQVTAGTYYIKGTRQGTCTDIKPVTVTVSTSPTVSISSTTGGNQLTCTTGSLTLNASASSSFVWDNGSTAGTRNVNAAGTYTVTATSVNGCTTVSTFTVFQNTTPPIPFINGNTSPICQGATVTLTSMPYIFNNAIRFDGVAQSAELGSWFNYQTFTIEMWLKPGATQSPDATIIDNNFESGGKSWTCKQNASANNQYQFICYNTLGASAAASFTLSANIWQHVTLVKTLTSLDVYLNGVIAVSTPWTLGIINYDGSEFLRLGAWGGQNRYWNGSLDEVRIFNKDISAARIAADMNAFYPANTANLIAQYKMDEPDNSVSISNATGYIAGTAPVLGNPNFLPSGIPLTGSFTHSWTPGGSTSPSVSFTPTGPVVYQVTSIGSNGCAVTDTADITVSLSGLASITGTTPGCQNTVPATITLNATGAVAPYTFFYTINGTPGNVTTTGSNTSITVNHPATASGTFVYNLQNLTYSNASFCLQAQSGSDTLIVYPEPLISSVTPGLTCGPGSVLLSGTTSGVTIEWFSALTGGSALGSGVNFNTPVISSSTTYYAQAVNSQGCRSSVRTPVLASVDNPGQWLGYTIDWDTPSNWSCNILPTSTTDVTIPTVPIGGNFPVVNSTGLSVCRDLTIQSGASVTINTARSLSVHGDISNSGSPVWGAGEIRILGSAMQEFAGSASQQMGRLAMNNSTAGSALRLLIDLKIDQQVTFSDGVIDLNANTLTLGTATANGMFTGQSGASYINSNGGFTKAFVNLNGNYIWPVGDSVYYTPYLLQIANGAQAGAAVQVKVIQGMQPNLPAAITYLNRYWTAVPSGFTAALNFNATYIYAGGFEIIGGGPIYPVKYSLTAPIPGWAGCPGSSATVIAGTSGSHNPGTFTLDWQGLTAFSDFTGVGNNAPLPIELLFFEAHQELQDVLVNWATYTEINNDYFDVERGRNLNDFIAIGRVAGAGSTNTPQYYAFTDTEPYDGINYYRLKQTDYDGTSTLSQPVAVRFTGRTGPVVIYYDALSGSLLHEWSNNAGLASCQIFDATGRIVFDLTEQEIPENWNTSTPLPELQAGIYMVRFVINGDIYYKKMFIGK
jgi:predicted transglutaminase-like cysteine proteinase